MAVIAPTHGYNFLEKICQRTITMRLLAKYALASIKANPHELLVLLPSTKGLDLEEAILLGFPESQILVVDRDPDVVYRSAWSKKYPSLIKFCGDLKQGLNHLLKDTSYVVRAINADLCNTYEGLQPTVLGFFDNTAVAKSVACSFTLVRGHDKDLGRIRRIANTNSTQNGHTFHDVRFAALCKEVPALASSSTKILHEENYKATGRTSSNMAFMVVNL